VALYGEEASATLEAAMHRKSSALERLPRGKADKPVPLRKEGRPFAHPYYWAAFVLVGDPN
jgi:CHAT domain-containing protein